MSQVLVRPDGPEDVAGLQAGGGARGPGGQGHVLQRHQQALALNVSKTQVHAACRYEERIIVTIAFVFSIL